MKLLAAVALLGVALASTSSPNPDAPTGFDNKSNGMVDDATPQADQAKFEETETVADGLGPLSGDAYLNEMGITTRLFPDEVTKLCNTAPEPNDQVGLDGLDDVDHFARFIRASKAPARDSKLLDTAQAQKGSKLFDKIGCAECHVRALTTAPAGTKINGGTYTIPVAIGGKTFYPYSDFLLHNVGTGDGIVVPMVEHYGRKMYETTWKNFSPQSFHNAQNKLRTAPLWGVRFRNRLMHDGESTTLRDAILRHREEAYESAHRFDRMSAADQQALLAFLSSL